MMRLLALGLIAMLPAASAAAPAPTNSAPESPKSMVVLRGPLPDPVKADDNCRRSKIHEAQRRQLPEFKRLDQLPEATAYMAVYRTVDGCEIPMTVTEYRTGRR